MMPCGSDPSCSLNCLKQHAEISPWVQQSASCLVILSTTKSNNKPDPALLATCMQESLPEQTATPFQSNMARGMSALASVSLNECGNAFTNFATSAGKLGVCVGTCMQESSAEDGEDTIGSVVIPASFMCLTECALDAL